MASTGEARRSGRLPVSLFVLGALLLAVAVAGPIAWDKSHARAPVEGIAGYHFATAPPLSGWDDPRLARRPGEPTLPYVTRANRVVADAVYHCDADEPQTWATALLSTVSPSRLWGNEGVIDPASLRCGLCSQVTFVLAETLRRNGVASAQGRGLDGHVLVTFREGGREYAVGPDFGVDPFVIEWDEPEQVAQAATTAYREYLPVPPDWQRPLLDVFVDTSTDGIQDAAGMRGIAKVQRVGVVAAHVGRWLVVGVGALLVAAAVTSRRGVWRSGQRRSRRAN